MRAKRTDANQKQIVKALEKIGCTVQSLHTVGDGCPDLLIGFRRTNILLEVKTEDGYLNKMQSDWHALWNGKAYVVRSADEAVAVVIDTLYTQR